MMQGGGIHNKANGFHLISLDLTRSALLSLLSCFPQTNGRTPRKSSRKGFKTYQREKIPVAQLEPCTHLEFEFVLPLLFSCCLSSRLAQNQTKAKQHAEEQQVGEQKPRLPRGLCQICSKKRDDYMYLSVS